MSSSLPIEAITALESGRKIDAIKIVRAQEGLDLKAAKMRVDSYLREHPGLMPEREAGSGMLFWAILVGGAVMAWYWLSR